MDEKLRVKGRAHYEGLVESVKRRIPGDAAIKFEYIEPPSEDRYDRSGFVLSVDDAETRVRVEFFPHGDSSTPRLADQPFLIVLEWDCGAFYVEISRHYPQRYWNTDIDVTGYVDFRKAGGTLPQAEEAEQHLRLSNDEMAERLLQTLLGSAAI